MRKLILTIVISAFCASLSYAYDDYGSSSVVIVPNKSYNKKRCGGEECNNLLSNSDVFIILDEPAVNRRTYDRRNYQKDFRRNNVYDPRISQNYGDKGYDRGYDDGYNDALNDYGDRSYGNGKPQIGIRIR